MEGDVELPILLKKKSTSTGGGGVTATGGDAVAGSIVPSKQSIGLPNWTNIPPPLHLMPVEMCGMPPTTVSVKPKIPLLAVFLMTYRKC